MLFFDSSWASFWKNFFWRSPRCKNSKQDTTALVITAANYATKKKERKKKTISVAKRRSRRLVGTSRRRAVRVWVGRGLAVLPLPLLSVIMIIQPQHSTSSFVERHLSSQIRSDFLPSPRSPIIRFLFPACPSPLLWAFFFLFLVPANHTQEGCRG